MRRLLTPCRLLVLGIAVTSSAWGKAQEADNRNVVGKPNILVIVADDLGFADVGFNGAKDIKTPNLDRLAAAGQRFESLYAQPFCTPTRAAFMTGRYPMRYGLQTFAITPGHPT